MTLAGCGASVTSKTNFNSEGGGVRSISAIISASDAKNLSNGFEELDTLLKQAAPPEVTISRTNLDNGDAKYQFSIQFSSIEDYNQKVSAITGTSHNATWRTGTNAFLSSIEFSEEDCTYDLISWAIKAFKDSKYSAFSSYFTLYDVTENQFYFEDELVYSGTGDPSFRVEASPKLLRVNIYSDFSYDKQSKKVELLFEKGSLDKIDLEAARQLLESYSNKVFIDTANSKIIYELDTKDDINHFLKGADYRNQEGCIFYEFVYNPFQEKYHLQENYYLTGFLSNFTMVDPYVYVYVKLPEITENTSFTQSGQAVENPGTYHYGTSILKDTAYTMETVSNQMVDLKEVKITYDVTNDLSCKRSVEISYIKNDCNITKDQLVQYFPNISENVTFFDAGDTIRIVFVSTQKKDSGYKNEFGFQKLPRENLKYIRYGLQDNLDLSRYLPVLEGYKWNLDNIVYNYQISTEKDMGLYEMKLGSQVYSDAENTLKQWETEDAVILKGTDTLDQNLNIELSFKQVYHLFYFWIIIIIFIIVVAVLGITLYHTKIKSSKIEENIENE